MLEISDKLKAHREKFSEAELSGESGVTKHTPGGLRVRVVDECDIERLASLSEIAAGLAEISLKPKKKGG